VVEQDLHALGLDPEEATAVLHRALEKVGREALRQEKQRAMIEGGAWCLGGLFVTAATYVMAAAGETYFIAHGAIL
jgi:hypothetical protein